jgi:hypothetical protein
MMHLLLDIDSSCCSKNDQQDVLTMINVWTIYDEPQMCGNGDGLHVLTMINVWTIYDESQMCGNGDG